MNTDNEKNSFNSLKKFICDMENIPPSITHPDIKNAVKGICNNLRIAYLEASLIKNSESEVNLPHPSSTVYFSAGEIDNDLSIIIEKDTHVGIAVYTVRPYKNAAPWTDSEKENINAFISALFINNSRARTMNLCEHLCTHDYELGVYNIKFFEQKLTDMLTHNAIKGFVCCRFNLKKFSLVNKLIGRKYATDAMKKFLSGLENISGNDNCLCRLGGDHFILLFRNENMSEVRNYLNGTQIETDKPDRPFVTISARAGFYNINGECQNAADIIDRASTALNIIKKNTNQMYLVYNEEVEKRIENQRMVEENFFSALDNEEFIVYYQPKVELRRYSLSGAEALCRWKHNGKLIPPGMFIPVLEQNSNICTLDFYMLDHVCRDIRRWLDNGVEPVRISVNISRIHLGSEGLSQKIMDIIKSHSVPFEYIEIELTETTSDVAFSDLKKIVKDLHNVGISTSIDDFGIGYSSLNLIRDLPWNTLKIDKSFLPVRNDSTVDQKMIMLKYVIAMAQSLGLECLVEGVETTEQVSILKENDCYQAQGFCFDKPLPVEEFEERLRTKKFNFNN